MVGNASWLGTDHRYGVQATHACRLLARVRIQVMYFRAAGRKSDTLMAFHTRDWRLCVR